MIIEYKFITKFKNESWKNLFMASFLPNHQSLAAMKVFLTYQMTAKGEAVPHQIMQTLVNSKISSYVFIQSKTLLTLLFLTNKNIHCNGFKYSYKLLMGDKIWNNYSLSVETVEITDCTFAEG